jgi:hypothetical protein
LGVKYAHVSQVSVQILNCAVVATSTLPATVSLALGNVHQLSLAIQLQAV